MPAVAAGSARVTVSSQGLLLQRRSPRDRCRHLDHDLLRSRQQYVVRGDLDVLESRRREAIADAGSSARSHGRSRRGAVRRRVRACSSRIRRGVLQRQEPALDRRFNRRMRGAKPNIEGGGFCHPAAATSATTASTATTTTIGTMWVAGRGSISIITLQPRQVRPERLWPAPIEKWYNHPVHPVADTSSCVGLKRELGRWDLTAVGVNQVIGGAVFALPRRWPRQRARGARGWWPSSD